MTTACVEEAVQTKGDLPGHPFRGNQWEGGTGSSSTDGSLVGTSLKFDPELENREIKIVKQRVPGAVPLRSSMTDDEFGRYGKLYEFYENQKSGDWDRIQAIEQRPVVEPVIFGGTIDNRWATDGTHRLAIAAHRGQREFLAYYDNPGVYKSPSRLAILYKALEITTQAVRLKQLLLKDQLRNAVVKAVHVKQYAETEAELTDAMEGLIKRQFKEAGRKLGRTKDEPELIEKGDLPGHPFRGNQWEGGGGGLIIEVADRAKLEETKKSLGLEGLSDDDLIRVTGVVGTVKKVKITPWFGTIGIEIGGDGFELEQIIQRSYTDGSLVIENKSVKVYGKLRDQGFGTNLLLNQVRGASGIGISRLECNAAGFKGDPKGFNGYYTWPRLGFDGPIPGFLREKVDRVFPEAKNISDLLKSSEGRSWWKENGDAQNVSFDLKEGSQSRRVLDAYVAERAARQGGKSTGVERNGRGDFGSNLGQDRTGTKSFQVDPIFDPRDWDDDLVNTALPILMKKAGEAAAAQMLLMGLDIAPKGKRTKGDLPGHPFRGNQWSGGMMAPDRDMGSGVAQPAQMTSETGQKAARIIRKLIMSGGDVGDTAVTDDVAALLADSIKDSQYKVFRGVHVMKNRVLPQQYEELKKLNPGDKVPEHLQKRGNDYASTSASAAVARYYAKDGDVELVMSSSPRKEQILADLRNLQQAFVKHGLEKEFAAEFDENDIDYFKKDKEVFVKRGTEFIVESIKVRHKSFLGAVRSFQTKASRATEWLLNLDDADIDTMALWPEVFTLPSGLTVDLGFATEWPDWMKVEISKQMKECFEQSFWAGINDTTAKGIQSHVLKGIEEGWSIREIQDEMVGDGLDEYYHNRGVNIARTESGNALNGARSAAMDRLGEEVPGLRTQKTWMSVLGTTTRDSHASLDGVPADRDGMWYLDGYHIPWPAHHSLPPGSRCNCFPAETLVSGRFNGAQMARYEGTFAKIVTRSGAELTLTPNHPVVTSKGLVAAGMLKPGDQVACYRAKSNALFVDPGVGKDRSAGDQVDDKPSLIKDVFEALAAVSKVEVVGSVVGDFYGDGKSIDGDICIVRADGELLKHSEVAGSEKVGHGVLALSEQDCLAFEFGNGPPGKRFWRVRHVPPGDPSLSEKLLGDDTSVWRISPSGSLSVGVAADFDSSLLDSRTEDGPGVTGFLRQALEGYPGNVTFDDVVEVRYFDSSCHVYDLQSEFGTVMASDPLYTDNREILYIIVSNCQCSIVQSWGMGDEAASELIEEYNERLNEERRLRDLREKGDKPGHPFRGNQWSGGRAGAESGSTDDYGADAALDMLEGRQPPNAASSVRKIDQTGVKSDSPLKQGGANVSRVVEIEDADGVVRKYCFKPDDGENPGVHPAFLGHQSVNEVASGVIDEAMGLGMVAKVEMAEIGGRKGSLQEWINDDATKAIDVVDWNKDGTVKSRERLDKVEGIEDMMYFDALTGNADRHLGNYLVKDNKIKLIDNGMSMADNMEYGDPKLRYRTMEHAGSARAMTRMSPKFKAALTKLIDNKSSVDSRLRESGVGAAQRASFWKRASYIQRAGMLGFGDSTMRDLGRLAEGGQLF